MKDVRAIVYKAEAEEFFGRVFNQVVTVFKVKDSQTEISTVKVVVPKNEPLLAIVTIHDEKDSKGYDHKIHTGLFNNNKYWNEKLIYGEDVYELLEGTRKVVGVGSDNKAIYAYFDRIMNIDEFGKETRDWVGREFLKSYDGSVYQKNLFCTPDLLLGVNQPRDRDFKVFFYEGEVFVEDIVVGRELNDEPTIMFVQYGIQTSLFV